MPITATMSPGPAESISDALVGVHFDDAAESLLLTGALIEEGFALLIVPW